MFGNLIILAFLTILSPNDQKNIHDRWDNELKKYVSDYGKVNYKKWNANKHGIKSYIEALRQNPPKKNWSKNEMLSYWINAYNALTILLILDNYPLESIKKIKNPWKQKIFSIDETNYSLSEIEHKILRKMNEPKIHFAINCGSISCPNLSNDAYRSNKLEKQLEAAAKKFLNDESKNVFSEDQVKLSKIFLWFNNDFGSKKSLVKFINLYAPRKISEKTRFKYLKYNWLLNE